MSYRKARAALSLSLALVPLAAAHAEQARVIDLGTELSSPVAINNGGSVVGGRFRYTPSGGITALIDAPGVPSGLFGGGTLADINNAGTAVGYTTQQVNGPGSSCPTDSFPIGAAAPFRTVLAISDNGDLAGQCEGTCDAALHIRRYRPCANIGGRQLELSFTPADVNAAGQMTGTAGHAVFYDPRSGAQDLGTLGGSFSQGLAINAHGAVVGVADRELGQNGFATAHAFLYDPSNPNANAGLQDLGTLGARSEANGINSSGVVVGTSRLASGKTHAFIYDRSNGMRDLNTLLPPSSRFELLTATDINELGEITGTMQVDGDQIVAHGFVLTNRTGPSALSGFHSAESSDFAVWRPETGTWFVRATSNADAIVKQWGLPTDQPISGDYDGDGKLDLAVWRPSNGTWYLCFSSHGYNCAGAQQHQFGLAGDYPVSADFDGDGKSDLAVYRALLELGAGRNVSRIEGQWYIRTSKNLELKSVQWGLRNDLPVPADYDGDGIADLAVFRQASGEWFILRSSRGFSKNAADILYQQWGIAGDHPIPADFDGDGRADLGIFRPSTGVWHICSSVNNYQCAPLPGTLTPRATQIQFGLTGDMPLAADLNGDGSADLAVYRPLLGPIVGTWYRRDLGNTDASAIQWGLPNDVPVGVGVKDIVRRLYGR